MINTSFFAAIEMMHESSQRRRRMEEMDDFDRLHSETLKINIEEQTIEKE
jgi:hypothetical protein